MRVLSTRRGVPKGMTSDFTPKSQAVTVLGGVRGVSCLTALSPHERVSSMSSQTTCLLTETFFQMVVDNTAFLWESTALFLKQCGSDF